MALQRWKVEIARLSQLLGILILLGTFGKSRYMTPMSFKQSYKINNEMLYHGY